MKTLEDQFKALLVESISNDNEAARELAKEAAIKFASNFTEPEMTRLLGEFSAEHLEK